MPGRCNGCVSRCCHIESGFTDLLCTYHNSLFSPLWPCIPLRQNSRAPRSQLIVHDYMYIAYRNFWTQIFDQAEKNRITSHDLNWFKTSNTQHKRESLEIKSLWPSRIRTWALLFTKLMSQIPFISDDGGHEIEHPVNEILAIRLYHVIYTIFRIQALSDAVLPSVGTKQSAWKLDCQWVPLKILRYRPNGFRSDIPHQRIWNSHKILH